MDLTRIPELATPRLRLRAFRDGDFDACAAMWSEPAVVRFIGGAPLSREAAWARFLRQIGHWHHLGFGFLAIEERATGHFVGEAGFHDAHRNIVPSIENTMEAGWVLSTAASGQGLAEEAMRALLAWADAFHTGKRITCIIRPDHVVSLHIAAKLGFGEFARADYNDRPITLLERVAGEQNS